MGSSGCLYAGHNSCTNTADEQQMNGIDGHLLSMSLAPQAPLTLTWRSRSWTSPQYASACWRRCTTTAARGGRSRAAAPLSAPRHPLSPQRCSRPELAAPTVSCDSSAPLEETQCCGSCQGALKALSTHRPPPSRQRCSRPEQRTVLSARPCAHWRIQQPPVKAQQCWRRCSITAAPPGTLKGGSHTEHAEWVISVVASVASGRAVRADQCSRAFKDLSEASKAAVAQPFIEQSCFQHSKGA